MRFRLVARRVFLAAALGLALASAVTACSSSSSSASTSSAPSSSALASSASASSGDYNAAAQIKANWEAFFSGTTSAAKKISLLQNCLRGSCPAPGWLAFLALRSRPLDR